MATISQDSNSATPSAENSREWLALMDDDFTDSVCMLLPKGQATLVDVWAFDLFAVVPWKTTGRTIMYIEWFPVRYIPGYFGKCGKGKRRVGGSKKVYLLHRDIHSYANPCDRRKMDKHWKAKRTSHHIDHINRNPWDNRAANLRLATPSQNAQNKAKCKQPKSSRYKGVSKTANGKWMANIKVDGNHFYLGAFDDEVKAAEAYNAFVRKNCPEFGYLNPL